MFKIPKSKVKFKKSIFSELFKYKNDQNQSGMLRRLSLEPESFTLPKASHDFSNRASLEHIIMDIEGRWFFIHHIISFLVLSSILLLLSSRFPLSSFQGSAFQLQTFCEWLTVSLNSSLSVDLWRLHLGVPHQSEEIVLQIVNQNSSTWHLGGTH